MRFVEAPNRRVQDSFKHRLLCGSCEQRLSVWESSFASQVFLPMHRQDPTQFRTYPYQAWGMKFAASVVWRVVQFLRANGSSFRQLTDAQAILLDEAEGTWRAFLLGEAANPGPHEIQL